MTADALTKLKFPIGPFVAPESVSTQALQDLISTIEQAPARYEELVKNVSAADLKRTYRDGSWNVQQLMNHVADMQLLHLFRMKKALTETDYKEITLVNIDGWAHTSDGLNFPLEQALAMFKTITARFVFLMRSLNEEQLEIAYYHPVRKMMLSQKQAIAMSAWHVRHHLEHIRIALAN